MTVARSSKINLNMTAFYHCVSRCVRRSYLCGTDFQTGKEYNHRKKWIVSRLKELCNAFAIKICAYAVMSNHYHLVLFVDEKQASNWSAIEVFERWKRIFPNDAKTFASKTVTQKVYDDKIEQWRDRLISISWFMSCMNEIIARRANLEDDCTGRFWEGRFKSQALLDDGAVLSAMAYVDLNPIRANAASSLENSDFTSIQERLNIVKNQLQFKSSEDINNFKQPSKLMGFRNHVKGSSNCTIDFALTDYLQLVDETGRLFRENKTGVISEKITPILERLKIVSTHWLEMLRNLETSFYHAIGETSQLILFAQNRKCQARGLKTSDKYYSLQAA